MSILRILVLTLLVQNAAAQQPRPASVEGIVVKTGGGEPIAKAVVALAGTVGSDSYTATAAADGKFAFANVVPGRYRLTVTRNGYLNSEYGQRGPNGTGSALTVAAGQEIKNVRLSMTAAAAISGRIYDSDGEPVVNMAVQALKYSYAAGQRRLTPIKLAQTDDRGSTGCSGFRRDSTTSVPCLLTFRLMPSIYPCRHPARRDPIWFWKGRLAESLRLLPVRVSFPPTMRKRNAMLLSTFRAQPTRNER